MKKDVVERFLRYVKIDTQSDESSKTFPSTMKQFDLLNLLKKELEEIGLEEVHLSDKGYLTATLSSNVDNNCPVVGFLAHVDTSPDVSGKNVNPIIHRNYDGKEIKLPCNEVVISPKENPELQEYLGWDIITGDGTTLLGADDKAGIAEIMSALKFLKENPLIPRGKVRVCFSPDEEIGRGTNFFDVEKFGADFAYTVDGGVLGEIECENFNAAVVDFKIKGINVHPGYAKDIMVSSIRPLEYFLFKVSKEKGPECSSGREGFIHPKKISGNVSETIVNIDLRDFSLEGFEDKKKYLRDVANELELKYPKIKTDLVIKDLYFNMKEFVDKRPEIMDIGIRAIKSEQIKPLIRLIRGGTDGARLSRMGLPAPNLFGGGSNFHSEKEFIPVQSMEKAVRVIVKIISLVSDIRTQK